MAVDGIRFVVGRVSRSSERDITAVRMTVDTFGLMERKDIIAAIASMPDPEEISPDAGNPNPSPGHTST